MCSECLFFCLFNNGFDPCGINFHVVLAERLVELVCSGLIYRLLLHFIVEFHIIPCFLYPL